MDVHCTTCGEPWDAYHLRHDAIFETGLCHTEAKAWTEVSPKLKLLPRYREKFKAVGFEFGSSILNVMRCPACPKDATPHEFPFRLRAGDVFRFNGRLCRVLRVNYSSAVVIMNRPVRNFKTRFDQPVRFQPPPALFYISPDSEVTILNRKAR
jgi:hypothetical protein